MHIRQENTADHPAVHSLVRAAFATAEHSDGTEQDLVAALRQSAHFVPELALVAELEGRLVGHILFSTVRIGGHVELALAPLSVHPQYQRRGIGLALMAEGHRIAKELGFCFSVVLGSAAYYPKAGYVPAARFGICPPFAVPEQNYMALNLRGLLASGALRPGTVEYAKEFGI